MKRVRTKETMGNKKKRSKKHDETHPFPFIPLDLIVEILLKVPARSLARLVFVSKLWSSIIRDKGFTKLYLSRSPTRPRLLFLADDSHSHMKFLQSCSQEDLSSDHHRVKITDYDELSPPVRGLMCLKKDSKLMILNASTGQFLTLPDVKPWREGFLGYDPVNDVYKVLRRTEQRVYQRTVQRVHERRRSRPLCCMPVRKVQKVHERPISRVVSRVMSVEYHVFTLGGKQEWRRIECKHHHDPDSKGICINGVVYYYALIESKRSLISFDLISEEFNVIKLPKGTEKLVNYNGKIALTSQASGTLNLWVLEDACKQEWSKISLLIPSWTDLVGKNSSLRFRGILSTGELIFSPCYSDEQPFCLISFDIKKNNTKKIVVEGIGDDCFIDKVYLDHVECPMVL